MKKINISLFMKLVILLISLIIIEVILITLQQNKKVLPSFNPKIPIVILVDVSSSTLRVYQDDKLVKGYVVATGKPNTPSPIGTWKIVNKDFWGGGFGGYWMGINVPWGKYGIHGTLLPGSIGWNSSQGCIRMKNEDIIELFKITQPGSIVIISGGPFGSFGNNIRNLKQGNRGAEIFEIQTLLRAKGYIKSKPNGIYDVWLTTPIHKFQKDNNLPVSDELDINFYKKLGMYLGE